MTTRRSFLAATSALLAANTPLHPAGAAEFEFRAGSTLPVHHPSSVRFTQMWDEIARVTGGRLQTRFFPNNALGGDAAMFSQLRTGAIQFMVIAGATFASVVPATDITNVGFAFENAQQALRAVDGPLGDYIRGEIEKASIHPMHTVWDSGMREMTSSLRPIRTADDLAGFKIRVVASRLTIDLFKTLGADPTPLDFSELYTALQTRVVDGCDLPLNTIESARIYEVQRYLSLTNHNWSSLWVLANGETWKQLPTAYQELIERSSTKFGSLERRDSALLGSEVTGKLRRQGLAVNTALPQTFRARLGPYYRHCKELFGPVGWGLLEQASGQAL